MLNSKKIVIAGGSGFIGQAIAAYFGKENKIVILGRQKINQQNNAYGNLALGNDVSQNIKYVQWDAKTQGDWSTEINNADLVINLAGKSVNCRYTEKNKQEIFDSRIFSTHAIGEAIKNVKNPPKVWINAASATIYRNALDRPQDELTGEIENDFSVQVCKKWEQSFFGEQTPFTRKIALRMAITLGEGGVIIPYFNLLKFYLGGQQGNGKQMYSWVHIGDVCRMMEWAFENDKIVGVYNCSSPNPLPNKAFMATMRRVCGHKIGLPAYTWMLKIGTAIIGTEPELVLKSRWVIPTKALQAGFFFKYPLLENALKEIVSKTPRRKYHLF